MGVMYSHIVFGSITTAAVLALLFSVANTFQPLPEDVYRYGTIT